MFVAADQEGGCQCGAIRFDTEPDTEETLLAQWRHAEGGR